jgi:hypothetical protein
MMRRQRICSALLGPTLAVAGLLALPALAQEKKPNILVIWGDDIGQSNISAYTRGWSATRHPTSTGSPTKA